MGVVVDAVSSVVEGAVDAVGTVAEAAVDVAGSVVEAVASNPLLIAAAVAAPYAVGAMGAAAGTTATFGAADLGLAGLGTGMLEASVPSALSIGAGFGYGTAAGLGAGTALGAAEAIGGGFSLAGLGSIYSDGAITSAFNFAPVEQATNFGTSILDATGSSLAEFNAPQTAASTVMGNSPTYSFNADYLSSQTFTQAQEASSLVQSPGMSFSNAISQATGGTVAPTNATSMFTNAWDSAKGIINQVNDFTNKIGQTIAPNADPMVQKAITNFGTNMVTTGGDVEQSLKGTAIGTGAGFVGKQVADLASPTLGATGAKIAGSTAANVAGSLATGAPIENALIGGVAGAAGAGTTNLTGSPLLGNIAGNLTGTALSGGDVGSSLLRTGLGAGTGALNQALGINPNSVLGKIVNPIQQNMISSLTSQKTNVNPIRQASSLTSVLKPTPTSGTTQKSPLSTGVKLPAQQVDVSKLTPVDITTLGLKG